MKKDDTQMPNQPPDLEPRRRSVAIEEIADRVAELSREELDALPFSARFVSIQGVR